MSNQPAITTREGGGERGLARGQTDFRLGQVWFGLREIERQRGETELQRDRETKKQRDRADNENPKQSPTSFK